jgi:hypothetical protein
MLIARFTVATLLAFAKQNGGQSARRRASFSNSGGETMQQPSRFLAEISGDRLNQWNLRPSNSYQ